VDADVQTRKRDRGGEQEHERAQPRFIRGEHDRTGDARGGMTGGERVSVRLRNEPSDIGALAAEERLQGRHHELCREIGRRDHDEDLAPPHHHGEGEGECEPESPSLPA
jgi:hypothetical protein